MPSDETDPRWESLVAAALHHGVAPLLCRVLAGLPEASVPPAIAAAARAHLQQVAAEQATRVSELHTTMAILAAAGIPALAYKGPALAVLAHASPTMRPLRDLDVVVNPGSLPRAIAALGAEGYALHEPYSPAALKAWCRDHGQVTISLPEHLPVDLHDRIVPRTLAVDMDHDGSFERAVPLAIGDHQVQTFALEDTLLSICLHGTKEKWWRMLWVADVAALVERHPELRWDLVLARAHAAGMVRILGVGLALAERLFATPLPPEITRSVLRDPRCLQLAGHSLRLLHEAPDDPGSVYRLTSYHWHSRERASDRVRYAWRTLVTPGDRHYRMLRLPDALVRGYVALKLVHDYALEPAWNAGRRALGSRPGHKEAAS